MDDVQCIPFRETAYFSKLICDYLDQSQSLDAFYDAYPSIGGFKDQIQKKSSFEKANREILRTVLTNQYKRLQNPSVDPTESLKNIGALKDTNTFTVTTGHQLSLFTGPLYFIYKIVSVINLSERLNKEFPEQKFVPVYWMASEDHDFAEINHINIGGGRLRWDFDASGPVGRIPTESMEEVLSELNETLGLGSNADHIKDLFKRAYLNHNNLADATRYLVHELFGDKGLVIIDADDASLKSLAIPYFKSDLFDHSPEKWVSETSNKLDENYFNQVHPREINLFYIKDGLRERIEREGQGWTVLNTAIKWDAQSLEEELLTHPERFSPNVILRPLYQEIILPNLSYTGGGGELAYWFQLKDMFDQFNIPFPILMLRNSVLGVSNKQYEKLNKLDLTINKLFRPVHEIKNEYVADHAPMDTSLDPFEKQLESMFNDLETVANLTDRSMLGAVNAQRQKQLNGLENLKKKLLRAEKRKSSDLMDRIENLHQSLFPNGSLQERHNNFTAFYLEYGEDWITQLYGQLNPLKFEFIVANWK